MQKQSSGGVLYLIYSQKFRKIHRKTPVPEFRFQQCGRLQARIFIIKKTLAQVLSCKFCEIPKKTFYYRTPLVAASRDGILVLPLMYGAKNHSNRVLPLYSQFIATSLLYSRTYFAHGGTESEIAMSNTQLRFRGFQCFLIYNKRQNNMRSSIIG